MKLYLNTISIAALAVLTGVRANAVSVDEKFNIEPSTYYREIHQSGLSDIRDSLDFFMQAGADFHISQGQLGFDIKPEIRGLYGRGSSAQSTDPAYLTDRSPNRLMNLRQKLDLKDQWYLELEKLNLSYTDNKLEVSAGRKPVSLGVLKIFSVWNKFSRPLPVNSGPTLVYSSDSAYTRYQLGNWSFLGTVIAGSEDKDRVNLLEATYFGEAIEAHLLAARWWERDTAGFALAKDVLGATLRWENLWIAAGNPGEHHELQSGLGVEYALNASTTLLSEEMMQTDGDHNTAEYLTRQRSRFESLAAYLYNYSQIQYKLTSLWTLQGAVLVNMADWSWYAVAKVNYSYSQTTEFYTEVDIPTGRTNTEFSRQTVTLFNGDYLGAPTQYMVGARAYF